jgi:hypothetical protein
MAKKEIKRPIFRVEMFTGETKNQLFERILSKDPRSVPVTDVVVINLAKLGAGLEDGYMQIFARLRDDVQPEPVETTPPVREAIIEKTQHHYKLFWDCKLESAELRELNPQLMDIGFIAGHPMGANRLFNADLSDETLRKAIALMESFGFTVEVREVKIGG